MSLAETTDRAHIDSFPFEVLAIVFDFYVFNNAFHHRAIWHFQIGGGLPPQFVLKSVCKKWEKYCTSLPELWASLSINPGPAKDIPSGSPLWNQCAVACKRALEWSKPLPLQLTIDCWHLNDESIQTVSRMGLDEDVFDHDGLANRFLRLATAHSLRWKTFALRGPKDKAWLAGIPQAQLAQVAHRIPLLQMLLLFDLQWRPPTTLPPILSDIFMDAPCLSTMYLFNCRMLPLNFPWSQLRTEICIDTTWFLSFSQFADFFLHVMRQTHAHLVQWVGFGNTFEHSRHQAMRYPMIENPHVEKLRIPGLWFPRIRLPNLTSLEFMVSLFLTDVNRFGVSQIESLLADSDCRLLHLKIVDYAVNSEMYSIVSLLPYLDTLQTLHYNGYSASLIMSDHTVNYAVDTLGEILALPAHLPNLIELTLTIYHRWSPHEPRTPVHYHSPNAHLENAVWEIVQARMLGQRSENQLEMFCIQLEFFGVDVVKLVDQEIVQSSASRRIQATGVDFRLESNPKFVKDSTSDEKYE